MSAKLRAPMLLSPDDFHSVVRLAPLVSIDLIIRNAYGQVLLGLRNNAHEQTPSRYLDCFAAHVREYHGTLGPLVPHHERASPLR